MMEYKLKKNIELLLWKNDCKKYTKLEITKKRTIEPLIKRINSSSKINTWLNNKIHINIR